jgi:hypothetical protein
MKSSFLAGGLALLALSLPARAQDCMPPPPYSVPEPPSQAPYNPPPQPAIVLERDTLVGIPCCGPDYPRVWADFDFLLWWLKPNAISVPLITSTHTPEDLAANLTAGGIADPNAFVLFGVQNFGNEASYGGRLTFGVAMNTDGSQYIEASGFFLPTEADHFNAQSNAGNGNPALGLSYIHVFPGPPTESAAIVAGPFNGGLLSGYVQIANQTEMWGAEANFYNLIASRCYGDFYFLAGGRFIYLKDDLSIEAVTNPPDGRGSTLDVFKTRNDFYGGQVGLRHVLENEWWRLQTTVKFGFGETHETLDISGSSVLPPVSAGSTLPGGFYTASSNIGQTTQNRFGFVEETGVNLTYKMCDNVQLTLGYTFLFWNNVYRTGNQIDRNINPALNPAFSPFTPAGGPAVPARLNAESSFWAQGVNVGLHIAF